MKIEITAPDNEAHDPAEIAEVLSAEGYYVSSVSINNGEKFWENPSSLGVVPGFEPW